MTIEEQFTEIIAKQQGDHFMPFLKALTPAQKKLLVNPIKNLLKNIRNLATWLAAGTEILVAQISREICSGLHHLFA